jgi:hypothetical protein
MIILKSWNLRFTIRMGDFEYVYKYGLAVWLLEKYVGCIPVHIQQDATLHNLFYLETAVHVSGGIITHHQER